MTVASQLPELPGKTLGDWLLTPTKIYVEDLQPLLQQRVIKGAAHITGGGFIENVPRMLPTDLAAHLTLGSWPILPIFKVLQQYGQLAEMEMYNIFNMGIGMVLAVAPEAAPAVLAQLNAKQEQAYQIGTVQKRQQAAVELVTAK